MAPSIMLRNNFMYVKEQFLAAFHNSSVVVKSICVTVALGYFISFSDIAFKSLSVTPGFLVPPHFWIWTLISYPFMELHFWDVIIDICVIGLCGKLLEPLWGALEMLIFFVLINTCVAFASTLLYLFVYMCTFNTFFLFAVHIHGLVGYIAGVSVAVRQVMPDHILVTLPFGKFRNKHVPVTVLMLVTLLYLAGLLRSVYPIMFGTGLLSTWIYLRFYQRHSNGTRGDMADNFSFSSFFPDVIQPFIAVIANTIYSLLVKLHVCKKVVRKYDVGAPSSITISLPGVDAQDAERRRQKALKALNERLLKVEIEGEGWPSLDAQESPTSTPETPLQSPESGEPVQPEPKEAESLDKSAPVT